MSAFDMQLTGESALVSTLAVVPLRSCLVNPSGNQKCDIGGATLAIFGWERVRTNIGPDPVGYASP